ncbi:MAG: ATP-binding protein [Fimbriimonadaceae bacterium]|nr:MAG: GAF sensor signal transduction histidine kinase [Armatimonadetes bacterium OLB18]MCK6632966.1 ATP-binding protein [Fimbriimonadaceae bacterium]WKZ80088.1 MAG: ATP-binding protein [Fimbriimonadaceae bacterium]
MQLPTDVDELQKQLANALRRIHELELEQRKQVSDEAASGAGQSVESQAEFTPINEADSTLRRLVQRIAMILQADKIVIMFYDRETGELRAIPPAYGVDDEHLNLFKVRATHGVSGQVFRTSEPAIILDATTDSRTDRDPFALLHVTNGITVPLVIERRDDQNRVIDRTTIGVLHALNKRHGGDFNEEDVRLLERMARNVGSIIANLQLYREVVEEREELLQTFESLTAGLVLVSAEHKISQMNAAARAIFSVGPDCIGKQYDQVIQHDAFKEIYDTLSHGADLPRAEIIVSIAGVEREYQVQAAEVRNEEGKSLGTVFILGDVTEIKNIDRMKSSFVAMASHELRTPLTAIKGFVSTLLVDEGFSADDRREFYMIIDQECDRLTRLINDLLNTARIESNQSLKPSYQEVEFKDLIEKVVMIQKQSTQRHALALDFQSEVPNIIGDEDKLDQILTNLLNNAIKYSPSGGTITVRVRTEGEEIFVGVEDEGIGIPKDHLSKVFDKFHRVHNEDNRKIYGTGLGLYLVKHLVERVHLGRIWVESEVGKGSTFWVALPIRLDVDKAQELNA